MIDRFILQIKWEIISNQAEIDGLRAKRASELADRQAREKERREAEIRVNYFYKLN